MYYCINIYNFTVFIPSADYSDEGTYNIYMYSKSVSRHVHECVGSTFTRFVLLLKLFYFLFYLSVKHILLKCPISVLLQLFQKNGYDLNAYNNVTDILYNTDVITNIVKSIVHSPVGKLV